MENTEYRALLQQHFLVWDKLSPHEQEALLYNTTLARYPKGSSLSSREGNCIGMLLIKSGMLRTYLLSEEGRDITLYRMGEGEICILSASCILSSITFEVHIDAEVDTEVLVVGLPFFSQLSGQNIHVECFSYKLASERFSDVMWTMQQILFMGLDKRLAIFLLDEVSSCRSDVLHLTHEQVARYMGSAREAVTRMLKYFANEGIVKLSRGGIEILDKKKLRALT